MTTFFHENGVHDTTLHAALAQVCAGLVYVSETDAEVIPFSVDAATLSPEGMREVAGAKKDDAIEEVPFEVFFERLIAVKEWYGPEERERAERYQVLKRLLEEDLTGCTVFRIGKVRIRILAVGLDGDGRIAGIRTDAVET